MKVFVAMAFGHDDTDALYDKGLKPLLKRPGDLRPIRVDRSDRNDPIDEQIYRFMEESDLGVADLSYARPSVYFEAGWMRGKGKPVIFTCRADHLDRRKPAELADQLRVHFDLEQESIIAWKDAADAQFRRRLRARLQVVLAPLLKRRDEDTQRRDEEARFARLSPSKRCLALAAIGEAWLRAASWERVVRNGLIVLGSQGVGKAAAGVRLFVRQTLTKRDLECRCEFDERLRGFFDQDLVAVGCAELVVIVLGRVRRSTVESVFHGFALSADGLTFIADTPDRYRFYPRIVRVIDNVKSESELHERLASATRCP